MSETSRWTLTSPDGIGDLILRLPWLFAMQREGWHLQLVARSPSLELARLAGLKAEFVPLEINPYSKEARRHRRPFARTFAAIERFRPDRIFCGPTQPSLFEEELCRELSAYPLGGFVLDEKFWPGESVAEPAEIAAAFGLSVTVKNSDSEPERYAMAAAALLKKTVKLPAVTLDRGKLPSPPPNLPERFIAVSAGYREGDYFQGMGTPHWIRELRFLEEAQPLPFVFTGSSAEASSHRAIHVALSHPERHLDLTGGISDLAGLASLLSKAEVYVGKDSGTMHIASLLTIPVVAVFGGGHWARFLPAGGSAAILTVKTPCRGCDWRCHLPRPVCASAMPHGAILKGWQEINRSEEKKPLIFEFDPDEESLLLLQTNPQNAYPERIHQNRRVNLRREYTFYRLPLWRRVLSQVFNMG